MNDSSILSQTSLRLGGFGSYGGDVWMIDPWFNQERTDTLDYDDGVAVYGGDGFDEVVAVCPSS